MGVPSVDKSSPSRCCNFGRGHCRNSVPSIQGGALQQEVLATD